MQACDTFSEILKLHFCPSERFNHTYDVSPPEGQMLDLFPLCIFRNHMEINKTQQENIFWLWSTKYDVQLFTLKQVLFRFSRKQ